MIMESSFANVKAQTTAGFLFLLVVSVKWQMTWANALLWLAASNIDSIIKAMGSLPFSW